MGNQGMTNWKFSAFLAIALILVAGMFTNTAIAADGDGVLRNDGSLTPDATLVTTGPGAVRCTRLPAKRTVQSKSVVIYAIHSPTKLTKLAMNIMRCFPARYPTDRGLGWRRKIAHDLLMAALLPYLRPDAEGAAMKPMRLKILLIPEIG